MTIADELETAMQTAIAVALMNEAAAQDIERKHRGVGIPHTAAYERGTVAAYRAMFDLLKPVLRKLRQQENDADDFIRRFVIEEEDGTQYEPE